MANQFTPAIEKLYVAYFNRPADPAGLTYWEGVAAAAGNTNGIAQEFAKQKEYTDLFTGLNNDQIVAKVYQNLFGRAPDLGGLNYWSNELANGRATVADIVLAVAGGAQGTDKVAVDSKVTAAETFSAALDTVEERLAYGSPIGGQIGATYLANVKDEASLATAIENIDATTKDLVDKGTQTPVVQHELTEGIDKLVGTAADDNFVAVTKTWNALDSINGGAGNNSLTVATDTALTIPAGVAISNIQTVNLVAGTDIGSVGTAANVSGWTGVTTLNLSAAGKTYATAADSTNIVVAASADVVSLTGGKDVTVTHDGTGAVTITKAAGAVNVDAKGTGTVTVAQAGADAVVTVKSASDVAIGGGKSATVNSQIAYDTVAAHVDASDAAADAAAAAATALTAATTAKTDAATEQTALGTLKTALTASGSIAATNALTATAYGNGVITAAQKVQIDAAFAAGVKTNVATAQTAAAAVATTLITAADATYAAAVAAENTAAQTKATADAAATTAAAAVTADAALSNFKIDIDSATATTVNIAGNNANATTTVDDTSTLKNVLASATVSYTGAATLTGNALTSVTIANQANSVTVVNNGLNHTQAFTLDNVTGGVTVKDDVATTVNVVAQGKDSAIDLAAAAATTVNLSGAAALDLSGSHLKSDATIDASALAGNVKIAVGAANVYKGGTGSDTVTIGGAAQTKAVDGGAGSDTLVLTAAASYAGSAATKFANFENLKLTAAAATIDLSTFTGSNFASINVVGGSTVQGLTAAQAAAVTQSSNGTLQLDVAGATDVGQVDTVHVTYSDGLSARNTITAGALNIAGVENLQVTATDNVTISSLTGATAVSSIKFDGGGVINATTGALALAVNTVIDASAATRAVTIDANAATTNGLKIIGTSGTAVNTLTSNGFDSVLVGGNGNDVLTTGAGNDVISAGNGDVTVNAGAGNNKVTLGNGFNSIITGAGNDTIVVGSGYNTITTGAGADKITLAAHAAGVVDTVNIGTAATAAGSANMDTITGFISGQDKIVVGAGSFNGGGIAVTSAATFKALEAVIADSTTTVANLAAVYTALAANLDATALTASVAGAGTLIAREVTFTSGAAAGTYLVINDGVAGFQAANDIVVKLVGNTTVAAGDIVIA